MGRGEARETWGGCWQDVKSDFLNKNTSHFQVISVREKNIPQSMKLDYTIPSRY